MPVNESDHSYRDKRVLENLKSLMFFIIFVASQASTTVAASNSRTPNPTQQRNLERGT